MLANTWTSIVEANVRTYGEIVLGIDPYLPDVPAAFEQANEPKCGRLSMTFLGTA